MTDIPVKVAALIVRLEDGQAWLATTQNRVRQPEHHPATIRTARQRGLVTEIDRRGPPNPGVLLQLTPRGLALAKEIE